MELIIFIIILVVIANKRKQTSGKKPQGVDTGVFDELKRGFGQASTTMQTQLREEVKRMETPRTPNKPIQSVQPQPAKREYDYERPTDTVSRGQGKRGQHHEEWFPVPQGKEIHKCSYCGALNAVPSRTREPYICYFCKKGL